MPRTTKQSTTKCKYMADRATIKLAQTILSENGFRYFSRWAMDNSGYEIIRDNGDAAIPNDETQEWMTVKRCIPESGLAQEWCEIFTLAEQLKLAGVA